MRRITSLALGLALIAQAGCAYIQEPSWSKPWGRGAVIPAIVCGAIGVGAGIAIQNQRSGTSKVVFTNESGETTVFKEEDSKQLWKGALVGFPVGAAVCGILGHVFFDEPLFAPSPTPVPTAAPAPEPTPLPVRRRIVLRGVNFDYDESKIRPDSKPILDQAGAILAENEGVAIVVEGHTDSMGSDEYNLDLSIRRAEAVYRYLVNAGVEPERMRIEGYGKSRPVADNSTESGRAQNRRVELRILP